MRTTTIYGYSDDVVEVGGPNWSCEIDCYNCEVEIDFDDGTTIRVGYPKEGMAVWWIKVIKPGTAASWFTPCEDEEAAINSDIFEIESRVIRHRVVRK